MLTFKDFSNSQRLKYGLLQTMDHIVGRRTGMRLTKKFRKKFYAQLSETLEKKGEGKIIQIDRVKDISFEEFKTKYVDKGIPVVLEGAAKNWQCVKDWNLQYFKEKHGDDEIVISGDSALEKAFEITTLNGLIDNINSGGDKYYRFYPLLERHPEHIQDIDLEWMRKHRGKGGYGEYFQVFIGGNGTYTPLHNSIGANLFTQIHGEKHWRMYAPYHTMIIDPDPGKNFHRSAPHRKKTGPFNPFTMDFEPPYQLFKYIDCYDTLLKPGDVLYNPPHFWHAVKNKSTTIGMGYRWLSFPLARKSTRLYTFFDMVAINPPIWTLYKQFKMDYNLLHIKELGAEKSFETEVKQKSSKA